MSHLLRLSNQLRMSIVLKDLAKGIEDPDLLETHVPRALCDQALLVCAWNLSSTLSQMNVAGPSQDCIRWNVRKIPNPQEINTQEAEEQKRARTNILITAVVRLPVPPHCRHHSGSVSRYCSWHSLAAGQECPGCESYPDCFYC